jgi:transketolase
MQTFLISKNLTDQLAAVDTNAGLEKLAAAYRINCLAGLKSACHGWLGACFSSMELLTCIYHRYVKTPLKPMRERGSIHLSKGHAAMAQYAILAGLGCFPVEQLTTYKQSGGLPAHCDRTVPGVDSDSGSLGQGLSKAIGVALSNAAAGTRQPVFALIGDGELQEGQAFEAFLTLKKLNPGKVIPIIDRNHLQSDSKTADIKDADDWAGVFTGIGLKVLQINGHAAGEICAAIDQLLAADVPGVIIAKTVKGGGASLTAMPHDTARRAGKWHGQIPDDDEYLEILKEQSEKTGDSEIKKSFAEYLGQLDKTGMATAQAQPATTRDVSTGEAFATALLDMGAGDPDIFILDADLEKSCKLGEVARRFGERFLEIGISEQDMCSIGAGLGLSGRIAVINTYASFFKRSLDQIFACITEKVPVIFAAHYSGADYFTDGKSHQAINDLGLMQALGDIDIFEPIDAASTGRLLSLTLQRMKSEIASSGRSRPAYFRLHRTPAPEFPALPYFVGNPAIFNSPLAAEKRNILFTSGPHMLRIGLQAAKTLESDDINLDVVAIAQFEDHDKYLKTLVEKGFRLFSLEDHRRETGIGSFIASLGFRNPVRIGARHYCQSAMKFEEMLAGHCITAEDVCKVVKKVLGCSHEK